MREQEQNFLQSIKWRSARVVAAVSVVGGIVATKNSHESLRQDNSVGINNLTNRQSSQDRSLVLKWVNQEPESSKTIIALGEGDQILEQKRKIIEKVWANRQIFGEDRIEQYVEDLDIYYPIYKVAADRFDVPWYLLWIVHEQESTASRDQNAFLANSVHYGAMQRAKKYHPDEIVNRISEPSALLAFLPQRYAYDWREIIWAAAKLREDSDNYGGLEKALYHYSDDGPAAYRWQLFQRYSQVFED